MKVGIVVHRSCNINWKYIHQNNGVLFVTQSWSRDQACGTNSLFSCFYFLLLFVVNTKYWSTNKCRGPSVNVLTKLWFWRTVTPLISTVWNIKVYFKWTSDTSLWILCANRACTLKVKVCIYICIYVFHLQQLNVLHTLKFYKQLTRLFLLQSTLIYTHRELRWCGAVNYKVSTREDLP